MHTEACDFILLLCSKKKLKCCFLWDKDLSFKLHGVRCSIRNNIYNFWTQHQFIIKAGFGVRRQLDLMFAFKEKTNQSLKLGFIFKLLLVYCNMTVFLLSQKNDTFDDSILHGIIV